MSLLMLLIFLAVSLGIIASAFVWSEVARRDQHRAIKRLGQELQKPAAEAPAERLFKSVSEFEIGATATFQDGLAPAAQLDGGPGAGGVGVTVPTPSVPWTARLRDMLLQAGVRLTPRQFVAISVGAAVVAAVVGFLLQGWLLALPALLAGGAAPWFYLNARWKGRRNKLLRQLPAAFDLMARVLRAGLSMPQAFQGVAEAFESPIAGEFARCRDEQNLGVFPEVSLRSMAERTGVLEMKIFVMAMIIQRQTGGNLSDVLERLAGLVRERLRLRNQIRTLTAEGRLQAAVLLVLPVAMFFAMRFVNRPYSDVLLAHPEWLLATGALMTVGGLWIRKIIDIE